MRIHIIRHANPNYETDTLTPAGRAEASALASYLAALGINAIYASPYGRTRETAGVIGDALGLPVQVEQWATELPGPFIELFNSALLPPNPGIKAGNPSGGRPADHLRPASPAIDPAYPLDGPLVTPTLERIASGSDEFLARQGFRREGGAYHFERENRKQIAVVTHMGIVLCWLAHLLRMPLAFLWAGFFVYPASVTTVLFEERAAGIAVPRCLGIGDVAYLRGAGLYPRWPGLKTNHD